MTPIEAFDNIMSSVDTSDPEVCWNWPGTLTDKGYVTFVLNSMQKSMV